MWAETAEAQRDSIHDLMRVELSTELVDFLDRNNWDGHGYVTIRNNYLLDTYPDELPDTLAEPDAFLAADGRAGPLLRRGAHEDRGAGAPSGPRPRRLSTRTWWPPRTTSPTRHRPLYRCVTHLWGLPSSGAEGVGCWSSLTTRGLRLMT